MRGRVCAEFVRVWIPPRSLPAAGLGVIWKVCWDGVHASVIVPWGESSSLSPE